MLFAEMTLEPLVLDHYRSAHLAAERKPDLAPQHARLEEVLTVIDLRLGGREFLAGGSFTAADLVMASILHLASTMKLLEKHPRLVDYVLRHTRGPATRRAISG